MNRGDCWFEAVQNNDLSFVRNNFSQYKGSRDEQGNTALMIAAANKFCQLVDELARWEFGYKNNLGQTALMLSAISGCAHCVRALVGYEAGQLTHQGKTALMMAVFNGNVGAAKELLYSELHIGDGEHTVENYLDQALKSKKGDVAGLQTFKSQLAEIRSNSMFPFILTTMRRLDEQETLLYRAYATSLRVEGEQRQKELFRGPLESPGNLGTSFSSNRPPVRLPQISPAQSTNNSIRSSTQKSVGGQNTSTSYRSGFQQTSTGVPTSALRKQQEELSKLMDALKTDVSRLQRKQTILEADVRGRLPGAQLLDTAMQKSLDAELRISSLQGDLEELRARTDKAIEHQAAFGNTVMQMLGNIVKKLPAGAMDSSMNSSAK